MTSIISITQEILNELSNTNPNTQINNNNNKTSTLNINEISKRKQSPNKKHFHITYLRTVIQFLDYNSILSLTLVNKEFNAFFSSIYYYKFVSQINYHQKHFTPLPKPSSTTNNTNSILPANKKKQSGGLFSAITGALSYFTPSMDYTTKVGASSEFKEIETKIALHETLLTRKLKQLELSNEITCIRSKIDDLIAERFKYKSTINKDNSDEQIQQFKREKLESNYNSLQLEIELLKKECLNAKTENERLQNEDINTDLQINSITNYIKNHLV